MTEKRPATHSSGMSLGDIYHILFRHKWKIVLVSAAAFTGAFALPFVWRLPYQSEAKLFIRYVLESKSPGQVAPGEAKSTEERGASMVATEVEILTSRDLAEQVADTIGPQKILAKVGGGSDRAQAVSMIHGGILAEASLGSSVIRVVFKHPDPEIVQPVLRELIEAYLKKHNEIHRAVGVFDDFLTQETDQLRSRLRETEAALRKAKTNAHVISLEDSKKVFTEQSAKIQQGIYDAEAELAERQATVEELARLLHTTPAPVTNAPGTAGDANAPVPSDKVAKYRAVLSFLDMLARNEQDLLLHFTPESTSVKNVEQQITKNESIKKQMEEESPGLLTMTVAQPKGTEGGASPRLDLTTEMARVAALEAKVKVLTNQLGTIRLKAAAVDDMEGSITELQRQKELEEKHYTYFAANLEQSRIDERLGAGRVSNISKIQAPSPPYRDGKKLEKAQAILLFGGLGGSLALAFLIELYLDRSVKRPNEVEARLGQPVFLTIPSIGRRAKRRLLNGSKKFEAIPETTGGGEGQRQDVQRFTPTTDLAPWDAKHDLRPFFETLRDRLINLFEVKNLTHKPKLVAVSGCAVGAGVTTIAAGLAAALSETGEGNVLLVDMNLQNGSAHHFYRGNLECGLDEALTLEKRESAMVQEHLYVVGEAANGDKLSRVLPKRFTNLVPRLRASDYDYIIFDMPPITQTSITPRLARFMDMVFIVLEAEQTDQDVARRAGLLISESKANMGFILNKRRTYVPKLLQQEF